MEAGVLRDRIQSTLTADANIRRQAELDLRHVRHLPTCKERHDSTHANRRHRQRRTKASSMLW